MNQNADQVAAWIASGTLTVTDIIIAWHKFKAANPEAMSLEEAIADAHVNNADTINRAKVELA